jgi:CRP-like cAMP-binding protein
MSLESDIALLRGIPLLATLPTEQLRLIAFGAVRMHVEAGHVLFSEGTKASSGYVVLEGKIQLTTGDARGRQVVATCEPGSLIGELALLTETRRPATATAIEATEVLEIERKVVLGLLAEHPDMAVQLRAMLAERLNATVAELSRVGHTLAGSETRPRA